MPWSEGLAVGHADMDATHREMVALMDVAAAADKAGFPAAFTALLAHTRDHFAAEERMMAESGDPAVAEHTSHHAKLINELEQLETRVAAGRAMMAKAFIRERLPEWLQTHATGMDSMLAHHLNKTAA